ncbi:outer membrane lipoprotein-sorting protein [Pseudoteredinibacter isoporae]|uniref:outer membrane lipoprotein-sorting protein n=1 Tax=Pseudoteredinibacter isoporae TaxID=570281 RepID=UPI00310BD778
MNKYLITLISALSACANVLASPSPQDADALKIIQRSNLATVYAGDDGRAQARMLIVDKQGRKQIRQFTLLRRNIQNGGDQQFLLIFSRPSDVARTSFLVDKHPGSDDDRWLYLPGLDLLKRISAGDKRTSFVGSTFFYEDISGRDIHADTYEIVQQDKRAWTLKATPKTPNNVEFSYYHIRIDKQTLLPISADYFDSNNEVYRRLSVLKTAQIQGFPTVVEMKAENLRDGSFSINQLRNVEYGLGLPDSIFNERSLRMPPRKWLRSQ